MKDYQPESYLLYDRPYNCRIRIELEESIDGKLLSKAANHAIKRYPYFSVQVTVCDEKYVLVHNERPIVVSETKEKNDALGSEALNFHMVSIDYQDKFVFFNVSHSIAGASGMIPWIKTVLYLYLTEKYQVSLDPSGIRLPGSGISEEETAFPTFEELKNAQPLMEYQGGSGYFLSED